MNDFFFSRLQALFRTFCVFFSPLLLFLLFLTLFVSYVGRVYITLCIISFGEKTKYLTPLRVAKNR